MLTGFLIEIGAAEIGRDADHLDDRIVAGHLAADRVFAAPQALRQAGGNDGDLAGAVLLFEIAAVAQADGKGLEIPGTDEAHISGGQFDEGPRVVLEADDIDPGFAHERQGGHHRGVAHAGHSSGLLQDALEER